MKTLAITVFAKINLILRVFERNFSGYHDIEGIFQSIDLSDTLHFSTSVVPGLSIRGEFDCPITASTVYRAAKEFEKESGVDYETLGIEIHVEKGIPSQAGLGGASADAAATLWGLNDLLDVHFSIAELATIGEKIGSDVPFFLYGGTAIVRGKGEYIHPIPPRSDFSLVILQPPWGSSTSKAYELLDEARKDGTLAFPKKYRICKHLFYPQNR